MLNVAPFIVSMDRPSTVTVQVDYTTVDESAVKFTDYIPKTGTLTFAPGETSKTVAVNLVASPTAFQNKKFKLVLSNARQGTLSVSPAAESTISSLPVYAAVPFPGRRAAILGDSIFYMNHHWNPSQAVGNNNPAPKRYEFFATGRTGAFTYLNALLGQAFELEPAMQPNTNPGVNSTAPNNGLNFSVYSSEIEQWSEADFDPLAATDIGSLLAHNVGPLFNALAHIDEFDVAFPLGGTNDLSGGLPWQGILANIQNTSYALASRGKWVFPFTIFPRTADLLQAVNGVGGYNQAEVVQIMQNLLLINQGMRDWITNDAPNNIFLIDAWADLVGPTATLIPGVPTDPAGLSSPTSGIVTGSLIPSTPGNFRSDAPKARMMFDGLHTADPGAYVAGKVGAAVAIAAGVPLGTSGELGPLTIGPNLMANQTFAVSTTPRVLGQPLLLGRSTCLGTPVGWVSPGFPSGYAGPYIDHNANQGGGYEFGPVGNGWFLFRECNGVGNGGTQPPDGPTGSPPQEESYSNFNQYTFSQFTGGPGESGAVPTGYTVDSTFPAGCVVTSIVMVDGERAFRLTVNLPSGLTQNEGFVLRYVIAEGQHGPWDNYGFETGASASVIPPPYTPGEFLAGDAIIDFANLTGKFQTMRLVLDFLSINNTEVNAGDVSTSGAVISGIAGVESYFPFSNIANCQQHPEDKTLALRTSAVKVPTPASGENLQYAFFDFQFAWDCSTEAATAEITIRSPRIAALTGPTL